MKKYPKDIDKKSWDTMVEYTCYSLILLFVLSIIALMFTFFGKMIFFLAVITVVLLMIKDVV